MNNRIKKILTYLVPFGLILGLMAILWPKPADETPVKSLATTTADSTQKTAQIAALEGEQYTAMLDSIAIEGNLVTQLPNDPKLRPMRIVDGKPAMMLENGKIVVMANGQTGHVTVANGKMAMQMRDSSVQELSFKKEGITVGGKSSDDVRMALMMQGKMLDVTMENGKSFVTLPDSSKMELRVNNGQTMLVAADSSKPKSTMLRLSNGSVRPVTLDSGKLKLQVQPDKSIQLQKKTTAASPAQK